jgi:hypothetical protein
VVCIFGDNAYINSTCYLATPYTNASETKDDYNFFHSQLRIKIECTFEMYVDQQIQDSEEAFILPVWIRINQRNG